ncbi:DUF378 domain-containing protein [Candidatus Woesearchaeota archaeon]|nr:DUF378 domain-containing protein [Candidatus Woesearchaeota archaeon]
MAKNMNILEWIVVILVIVAALNWGLVGLFGFDVLAAIFGSIPMLLKVIYIIVGLAGLYKIYMILKK